MGTPYEKDVVAWAEEQAALLRAGKLASIDIEHIAEEIEDVGKSEQREFASRMAVLLAHLLKWKWQPERRGASWRTTIGVQREAIGRRLRRTPSLKPMLDDADWIGDMWGDARQQAANEMQSGFSGVPEVCPWSMSQVLDADFLPG
ncbi:DUF29 domain-containing protein [Caballeronia sp. J97]|uniref:DUF29 domain-containing protein n=1 Tax=Caballeronia sp. J97 TaxID=2805429 RepID=UPI002AB2F739|nr:DUF29 domain-containing protein [Caballeronia sp. J97]